MKPSLLVLAAGIGSRYGGMKQIDEFGPNGEYLLEYSLYDAMRAGFGKIILVVRAEIESKIRELMSQKIQNQLDIDYVIQTIESYGTNRTKPWGTAHAVLSAADKIDTPFAVINADDFYAFEPYKIIAEQLQSNISPNTYFLLAYLLKNTLSENGSVARACCRVDAQTNLLEIEEKTNIYRKNQQILAEKTGIQEELSSDTIVSMNFWGFTPNIFAHLKAKFADFIQENTHNPQAEFYIPMAVQALIQSQEAQVKVLSTDAAWFGVSYAADKPLVCNSILKLIEADIYPQNLWK